MAVAVIGGLIVSTVLSLLVVPSFYLVDGPDRREDRGRRGEAADERRTVRAFAVRPLTVSTGRRRPGPRPPTASDSIFPAFSESAAFALAIVSA